MFSSGGTVRYEERGQGYRDVEKVGKHCCRLCIYVVMLYFLIGCIWLVGSYIPK
jgi:hypothetical protein